MSLLPAVGTVCSTFSTPHQFAPCPMPLFMTLTGQPLTSSRDHPLTNSPPPIYLHFCSRRLALPMMRVPRAALVGSLASLAPRSSLCLAPRMMTSAASPAAPMPTADFGGWDPVGRSKLVPLVSRPDELYVVSSSSRGIGLEFATQLLQRTQGRVVGLARDPSGSAGMASLVQSHPDRFLPVQCDLTCQASVDAAGAVGGSIRRRQ